MFFFLTLIVIFLALATVIAGNVVMIIGGKINKKWSNKLMTLRVALQALAILMLFLSFMFSNNS